MDILEANIVGVSEAIKNITEAGATEPVVKATVMFSESGFASIRDAVVTGEFKDESIAGKSHLACSLRQVCHASVQAN